MNIQTVNNSVFMSFFEKEKLSGPNFVDWYRNMRIVLIVEDKLTDQEHPIPAAPVSILGKQAPAADALPAHTRWVKAYKEVSCLMLVSMAS